MLSGKGRAGVRNLLPGVKHQPQKQGSAPPAFFQGMLLLARAGAGSGLTWDGVIQDEGDAAPDEHGCGEQDVQHLIDARYSCSNRDKELSWGLFITHILLIYTQADQEHSFLSSVRDLLKPRGG